MTQDEIIEMAKEAGLYQDINVSFHQALRNFYDLATAKEREACAKIVQTHLDANNDLRTKDSLASVLDYIKFRGEA